MATNTYNPINLVGSTNDWAGVDTSLSGGSSFRTLIHDIVYSGSNLFFGGAFIYDYTNANNVLNYQLPADPKLQTINIGYFDTTSNRIRSIGGIGTFVQGSSARLFPAIYSMAMSGSNLVAAGNFNLINTQITSFECASAINRSLFFTLSDTIPFNANVTVGQVIHLSAYNLLFTSLFTNYLPGACFTPRFSGNYADSIAYYSPANKKWNAFANSTSVSFGQSAYAVEFYNNRIYTAGAYLSGTIFYNDGTMWQQVTPNMSVNKNFDAVCLDLYNDQRGNLIYCGTFSGFNGDSKKTGIMGYDGSAFFALGTGLSGTTPYAGNVVLSGDNYITCGQFDDRIASCNRSINSNFKRLYNGTPAANNFGSNDYVASVALSGSTVIFGGDFFDLNFVANTVGSINSIGNIATLGGLIDDNVYNFGIIPRIMLANVPVNYTLNSTISGDFTTSINLQTLRDNMNTISGITAYGSSPYQGISGINITP
jgi:hypothetical protein